MTTQVLSAESNFIYKILAVMNLLLLTFPTGVLLYQILLQPILIPFTGNLPRRGVGCRAASEVAIEMFNNNPNFLPEFHIRPVYMDGARLSQLAVSKLFEFHNLESNETVTKSPIIVGPYYTPGCKPLARIVHHVGMVQRATGCGSPSMTARRYQYPNFYRSKPTGEAYFTYGTLAFIKEIGKWKKIAILTDPKNEYNYGNAVSIYNKALEIGIKVDYFDIPADLDMNALMKLKKSGIRIIIYQVSFRSYILKFLCLTYKAGMTGGRYVFIMALSGATIERNLPKMTKEGCRKREIIQQMQNVKWSGYQDKPLEYQMHLKNEMGYSYPDFLKRYFEKLSEFPTDNDKKEQCFDAVYGALMALHNASPDFSMQSVNLSLANLSFVGFRSGPTKYSSRLELDYEPQLIKSGDFVIETQIRPHRGKDFDNISNYDVIIVNPVSFHTPNGRPPRENSVTKEVISDTPGWLFSAFAVLCCILGIGQIVLLAGFIGDIDLVLFNISCLFLNLNAILMVTNTRYMPEVLCVSRLVIMIFGFFTLLWSFSLSLIRLGQKAVSVQPNSTIQQSTVPAIDSTIRRKIERRVSFNIDQVSDEALNKIENWSTVIKWGSIHVLPALILFIVWMSVDRESCKLLQQEEPNYKEDTDETIVVYEYVCASRTIAWISGVFALIAVTLAIQLATLYQLQRAETVRVYPEFRMLKMSAPNTAVLVIAYVFIVVSLQDHHKYYQEIIGTLLLLLSIINTAFLITTIFNKTYTFGQRVEESRQASTVRAITRF